MEHLNKFLDSLIGGKETACKPTDKYPQLLIEAGLQLLPGQPAFNKDAKLSTLGEPRTVQRVLQNLNQLFRFEHNLANDILNDVTLGEMITHLDAAQVDLAIAKLKKLQKEQVTTAVHTKLDDLRHSIEQ